MKVTLRGLSTEEVNTIIVALGRCPHDDVFHLLQRIHDQTRAQLAAHNDRVEARRTAPHAEKV